jgi:ABC-type transport system substrate-binding protein
MAGILSRAVTLACLFEGLLLGCAPNGDPASERTSTVILAASGIDYMLPDHTDADFLVFLPLATRSPDGVLVPRLARSWEPSADWSEVTYHLRTDVRWHDGVPVTAQDVKYTLDVLAHPDLAEYAFDSVAVVNDSTVLIRNRQHTYIDDIVFYPQHRIRDLEPGDFYDWDFWRQPVGNGPYRFVRYEPATLMELEANPDFYAGKPAIGRVIVRFLGSIDAGLTELLAGNVDEAHSRNLATRDMLSVDFRFTRYVRYSGATAVSFVNPTCLSSQIPASGRRWCWRSIGGSSLKRLACRPTCLSWMACSHSSSSSGASFHVPSNTILSRPADFSRRPDGWIGTEMESASGTAW